jgi:hypothetical protein
MDNRESLVSIRFPRIHKADTRMTRQPLNQVELVALT